MSSVVVTTLKLSHKQFRAMLKKFRRKKKRQQLARERDHQELVEQQRRESSPNYKERELEKLRNSELFDQFEERESIRKHKQWLIREQQAQIEFRKKQEQLEIDKLKREEERKRIIAEFEQQQYFENKTAEENQKLKSKKEEVLQKTLSNLPQGDEPWHNPFAPESNARPDQYQGQDREQCQFFIKTGCCRFGDSCSRVHMYPSVSCTILIRGMYSHFSIGQTARADFDTDDILEYEDSERYQDFKNFYSDVLPEFKKYGKVVQFKVCSNHEPHLRGNVYVQFAKEENAVEAYKNFNGRYYAGRQITCQFTHVIKWRSAICGLAFRNACPKGINCNFLHVFKNPNNEFWEADTDVLFRNSIRMSNSSRSSHRSSRGSRRHSKSPSERRSSRRDHSSERRRHHRDNTPEYRDYYSRSHHRAKSSDSDSDGQENGLCSSSRKRHWESSSESSRRSHHKRKHKNSESKSRTPSPSSHVKKNKKSKHKKEKKFKKSKKEKKSDES